MRKSLKEKMKQKKSNKRDIYGHNEIIITKDSYIMNDSKGGKIKMTKEDLDKISCLKLFREKPQELRIMKKKMKTGNKLKMKTKLIEKKIKTEKMKKQNN